MTKTKRRPAKRRSGNGRQRRSAPAVASPSPGAPSGPLTIVGVGASAGGLEAFTELLESLPAAPGMALVLVQHLAPRHNSALPVLLAAHSAMPVVQVADGMRIQPNHVYVIPPNVQMELIDGTLALSPRPTDRTQHTPIDTFFGSLAMPGDGRAIAVVLSGTASDGAVGIRDVKTGGGITFAQRPESAKYPHQSQPQRSEPRAADRRVHGQRGAGGA